MAKHTQIVCEHLENVSREAFEQYHDFLRDHLHRRHGIYALYRDGSLHYVGLTKNLLGRLTRHMKDRHQDDWDRFSVYMTIDSRAVKELETLLLRIVDPDGNRAGGKFIKSQNLATILIREARLRDREKVKSLALRRRKSKSAPANEQEESETEVNLPPLAKYTFNRPRLRALHKGKRHRAFIRRDGRITHEKVVYDSPSAAAVAAVGHNINGWQFWRYERAPGDWVPLTKLRKRQPRRTK
jgi:hypothetical protein